MSRSLKISVKKLYKILNFKLVKFLEFFDDISIVHSERIQEIALLNSSGGQCLCSNINIYQTLIKLNNQKSEKLSNLQIFGVKVAIDQKFCYFMPLPFYK